MHPFILCQLLLQQILKETIAFGNPVVRQDRNLHDLHKDIIDESACNLHNENFINLLRQIKLKKDNYFDCMNELIDKSKEILKYCKNDTFKMKYSGRLNES